MYVCMLLELDIVNPIDKLHRARIDSLKNKGEYIVVRYQRVWGVEEDAREQGTVVKIYDGQI